VVLSFLKKKKKKELVGKVWVYETQIDNGYNKIKQTAQHWFTHSKM
jgi:hypothetical protein